MGKQSLRGDVWLLIPTIHLADFKKIVNLGYSLLILVAGLDGLGHHVWDTTAAELPEIPRLLQVRWQSRFKS